MALDSTRRRRICFVVRGRARSHPRMVKQACSLRSAGYQVFVVSSATPGEAERLERHRSDLVILRTGMGWIARMRWARRMAGRSDVSSRSPGDNRQPGLMRLLLMLCSRCLLVLRMQPLIRRIRPELLIAQDFNALPASWLGSCLNRIPLVYDSHEINVDREGYYHDLQPIIRRIEQVLIHRCDLIMTTTNMRARFLKRFYGLASLPLVFENRPRLSPRNSSNRIRERFGLCPDSIVALYQGGLQEGRGLHNLIKAAVALPNIEFVLIGDGSQRDQLLRFAAEQGVLDRNLHVVPWVDIEELPEWTSSADIGLQLLRRTCFNHWSTDSNKLFEYGMAGLAVVASDFPEIGRILRRHGFGVLVDPDDLSSIIAGISSLDRDRILLARMRAAAAENRLLLSWEHVEAEYVRSIEETLVRVT